MNNNFEINVSLIIRYKNSILIAKRSHTEKVFPGFWGIPGGKVEATDKSLRDALNRECLEEIGISFDSSLFKLLSENIILKNQKKLSKVFVIWTVIVLSLCIILLSVLTLLLLSFGYNM